MSLEICPTGPLQCLCGSKSFYVTNTWTTGAPGIEPAYKLNATCTSCGKGWSTPWTEDPKVATLHGPHSRPIESMSLDQLMAYWSKYGEVRTAPTFAAQLHTDKKCDHYAEDGQFFAEGVSGWGTCDEPLSTAETHAARMCDHYAGPNGEWLIEGFPPATCPESLYPTVVKVPDE